MVNLLGPGAFGAARPSPSRPASSPTNGPGDTDDWFKDCTSQAARDGTEIKAAWLNGLLAWLRNVVRDSGVPDSNLDDTIVTRAVRRGFNYAVAGGTANDLTVTLDPAPVAGEIAAGFQLLVKIASNNTGAVTLTINGGAANPVKDTLGNALPATALTAGSLARLAYDGTNWQVQPAPSATLPVLSIFSDSTPGTRTHTPGVTGWYALELAGAGGGGGGGVGTGGGGGGGAGAKVDDYVYLTAGTPYSYTIGAAGTGGGAGFNGVGGGNTSFVGPAGTVTANGGATGIGANTGAGGSGGTGGTGSGQSASGFVSGGQSGYQGSPQISQGGAGGSSPAGGFGGQASFGSGNTGTVPGGGGGGGTGGNAGGNGASGRLVLRALG